MVFWCVTAALAAPLGSPVALPEHGVIRVSASASANGQDLAKLGATSLRFDHIAAPGFGWFADATWIHAKGDTNGTFERGWQVGAGLRGNVWLSERWGLGGVVRGDFGNDWLVARDGSHENNVDRAIITGSPSLIYGRRDGGVYAWLGPVANATARRRELDTGSSGAFAWSSPPLHFGGEIGGEILSENLVSAGARGSLFLSTGMSLRVGTTRGLAFWVGAGF